MFALPAVAAGVAAIFAVGCWRSARGVSAAALRIWAVALSMFAVAAGTLAWGAAFGWTPGLFRVYYLFGAVLNVPWLGLGTVWLLAPRPVSIWVTVGAVVASAFAALVLFNAALLPQAAEALAERTVVSGARVFSHEVRDLSRVYSFAGLTVLVGGLGWSMIRRRGQATGLGLLLAGAMIVFAVSAYARRGALGPFSIGLAAGVTVMYMGFLRTRRSRPRAAGPAR